MVITVSAQVWFIQLGLSPIRWGLAVVKHQFQPLSLLGSTCCHLQTHSVFEVVHELYGLLPDPSWVSGEFSFSELWSAMEFSCTPIHNLCCSHSIAALTSRPLGFWLLPHWMPGLSSHSLRVSIPWLTEGSDPLAILTYFGLPVEAVYRGAPVVACW